MQLLNLLRRSEPLSADPHAGWCGEGGGEPRLYPIIRFNLFYLPYARISWFAG